MIARVGNIKKNDNVVVIAGRDRGKRGRVLRVIPVKGRVVCPECSNPTRVGRQRLDDGRRVRICRKCKGVVDK